MIFDILYTLVILQVGLTAGLLFIFSIAVNPGLARLNEEEYYRAKSGNPKSNIFYSFHRSCIYIAISNLYEQK